MFLKSGKMCLSLWMLWWELKLFEDKSAVKAISAEFKHFANLNSPVSVIFWAKWLDIGTDLKTLQWPRQKKINVVLKKDPKHTHLFKLQCPHSIAIKKYMYIATTAWHTSAI